MTLFIRSDIVPIDSEDVRVWVQELTFSQYFQVVTMTVLVFDAVITMDKEIRYFWRKTKRPTLSFVYFANRYTGIIGALAFLFWNGYHVDLKQCNFAMWTVNISTWITLVLIDYILTIRVLAFYSQDRTLSICLKSFLALLSSFKLAIVIYLGLYSKNMVGSLAKGVTVCTQDAAPFWQWGIVDWTLPMVYGIILMILAVYKAEEYWRLSSGFRGFTLVRVVVQDQVLYFLLAVSCCIFNILEYRLSITNTFVSTVLDTLGNPSFLSVLGSRMLFNLEEALECGQNGGTNYRASSIVSDVWFSSGPALNEEDRSSEFYFWQVSEARLRQYVQCSNSSDQTEQAPQLLPQP